MLAISPDAYVAFLQVVMIDLVLAGDNAVIIGLAAAGLPAKQRVRAVLFGIAAATVLRLTFAVVTTRLLHTVGLALAGGILLLWVCWKMWRDLRTPHVVEQDAAEALVGVDLNADGLVAGYASSKTLGRAVGQIVVADVSMSLDNVLAVAGAAREHPSVLVFGLLISIALMGIAASFIAQLLNRHRWIAYVGLSIILYVALDMIQRGAWEVAPFVQAQMA